MTAPASAMAPVVAGVVEAAIPGPSRMGPGA